MEKQRLSPIGKTVAEGSARRRAASRAYRAAEDEHASAAKLAKQLIHLRTITGLTQEELADLLGTTGSVISRMESGRQNISLRTYERVVKAQGARPIHGFELPAAKGRPAHRELVAI